MEYLISAIAVVFFLWRVNVYYSKYGKPLTSAIPRALIETAILLVVIKTKFFMEVPHVRYI